MTDSVLMLLAIACPAAVLYSYLLYPLLLFAVAGLCQSARDARFVVAKIDRRQTPRASRSDACLPRVAVLISAFNEEQHIEARLQNLLQQDYPAERLRIHVGSDGSTDRTGALIQAVNEPRLHGCVFPRNRGKASVLNDLVALSDAEILVFSDANTHFARGALRRLVARLDDPSVGCVVGELRLRPSAGSNQDGLYWRLEQLLKFFESRIGASLGANGAIYAIRRSLWRPLAADTICDDFCVAMNVAAQRARSVYEPGAWAEEDSPAQIDAEYLRRVRIGIGNFQALMRHPEYLLRTSWATRFAYLSHKVLRWIGPHLIVLGLALSALLCWRKRTGVGHGWGALALAEVGALGLAAALYGLSER